MVGLKEKSRILLRGMNLSGGAPRSTYEYLNILKNDGHHITTIWLDVEKELNDLYINSFDKCVISPNIYDFHEKRDYIGLYRQLKSEYCMLKKEKPDLVLILGFFNTYFYGRFCKRLSIPSIMMIAGGELTKDNVFLKKCLCDHVICFSEENAEVLKHHFENNRLSVISNRIYVKKIFYDNATHYSLSKNDILNVLITSRISADKYDSIIKFINILSEVACNERRIFLVVAGGGDCLDRLRNEVKTTTTPFFDVVVKGHIDDLVPEFEKAHIVAGKGRSVIEPIMMNRIGCIIGDDGKVELCSEENFERLYRYNFSGRHLECENSYQDIISLFDSVLNSTYDIDNIEKVSELVKKYYSAEFLPERFYGALDSVKICKQKKTPVCIIALILKMLWYKLNKRVIKQGAKNEQ